MTKGEKMQADFPEIEMWGESKDTLDFSLGGMIHRVTKSWWNSEYKEPAAKNDLAVDCKINVLDDFIEYAKKTFGIEITFKKSDNPDTYEKLFGTTKNDLGVDAVSRQAINGYIDYILSHGMGKKKSFDFIKKFVANLPSVTPIRPKGHWIGNYQVDFREWQEYDVKLSDGYVTDNCHCSGCGEELLSGDRGMFCPYCGSDNREVEE